MLAEKPQRRRGGQPSRASMRRARFSDSTPKQLVKRATRLPKAYELYRFVISSQRSPDTLERKLTHGLDFHGILALRQHPRTYQDLSWFDCARRAWGTRSTSPPRAH